MQSRLVIENGQGFVVFDDGAKVMLPNVVERNETYVALENGMIANAATAVAVARAECTYWRTLAEQRGVALADLRAQQRK